MKETQTIRCSECGGAPARRSITQEFERDGVRVTVSGIHALVCGQCGEVYFEPGEAQRLVEAVDRLFALARETDQHKGTLAASIS